MANPSPLVFTDAQVLLATSTGFFSTTTGATTPYDLSDFCSKVTLAIKADEKDATVMGMTSKARIQGLFEWSISLDINQGYESSQLLQYATGGGATGIDKLIYDLLSNKINCNVFVRPFAAARSSDNPEYYGQGKLFSHSPLDGSVGDLLKTPVQILSAGNISRLTSAS